MNTFTQEQINNWWLYEEIRLSGEFNMFDGRAREGTGMSSKDWFFNIANYDQLRTAAETQGTTA